MKDIILKAENISKQYRLGTVGTGTLKHDINRWWHRIRGKEDPYLKIGDTNDRSTKGESDYVWALQDISFEVERGEVLGIIGKNGAGKSTLLKILSKVTAPTTGTIKSRGRIASLLEVGTGFNGELTGRENVYLNGAILGMTKKEITAKLDEIIDFSGCQRYIDTPVKRYSSGMTVRLAFAVAAFLEPEILVIDEVLAVGDAEFQKKAIGKMQDISKGEGRTVLFVSHNMDSIMRLCSKSILLKNGRIIDYDITSKVIDNYLKCEYQTTSYKSWVDQYIGNDLVRIYDVKAHNLQYEIKNNFKITEFVGISVSYEVIKEGNKIHVAFNFYDRNGINIFDSHENNTSNYYDLKSCGKYETTVWIPENLLAEGVILVGVAIVTHNPFQVHFHERDCIAFNMIDDQIISPTRGEYVGNLPGIIRPLMKWDSKNKI
ncbi:lipopolysaccharide transport system ATP-binding protein [Flavobacterium flevense]|uniref:ABC transporter ATP-binding protein n=1 Tax=Flavobacterium flevense TaxID=983 RepID=A0A4Y4B351_9FLAO|nr:ABC transporter ATP-binding protein [Flavobacterium flevense]GEC73660.1 ABC transporter ATP-binding protein [Flavobacterium flevense]SHL99765.1 lipopolysaccharide transport system ATP-binding protein [Flavobacterium flevense]